MTPPDAFADVFAEAVQLYIDGKRSEAGKHLQLIPNPRIVLSAVRQSIHPVRQVAIFTRDSFTCRYCARHTIFCPLLRLMSSLFPVEFPFHPHWKMSECHIAFWREVASCDHLVPVARGGSNEPENLVTACYMCNAVKGNWLVEELRWTVLPRSSTAWDGLTALYSTLVKITPEGQQAYHRSWRRALKATVDVESAR